MGKSTKHISLSPHGRCVACWDCVGACPKGVLKKMNPIVHKHAIAGSNSSGVHKKRLVWPLKRVRNRYFRRKRRIQGPK